MVRSRVSTPAFHGSLQDKILVLCGVVQYFLQVPKSVTNINKKCGPPHAVHIELFTFLGILYLQALLSALCKQPAAQSKNFCHVTVGLMAFSQDLELRHIELK